MIMSRRNIAFTLIFLGILLRIIYASMSVDVSDAYLHVATAKSMRDCACIPTLDAWGTSYLFRPPSGTLLMALMMPYPVAAVVFAGLALIWLTYLIARKTGKDRDDSLLAAGIVAIMPVAVTFSSMNSLDMFTGAYLAAALLSLLSGRIWLCGAFSALGFLAKTDGLIFFPAPIVYLSWNRRWKDLLMYLAIFILIVSPWLWHMCSIFGNPVYPYFSGLFGAEPTPPVGHQVQIYHYLLGLPLTLFGVPEGSHRTALEIASARGIPEAIIWAGYLACTLATLALLFGAWKSIKKLDKDNRWMIWSMVSMYAIFFMIRAFLPIGSDVLDLRYAIALLPLLAIGLLELDKRWKTIVLIMLLVGSTGLYARFSIAEGYIQPLHEGLEAVKGLPEDAVVLSDLDTTIYAYGLSYETGRIGFPYMENKFNTEVHIPFLWENYSAIRSRGPNYLWTVNMSMECAGEQVFANSAVKLCSLS